MSRETRHRAAVFDRDGVLTRFDLPALRAFFEPIVPLTVAEVGARWQRHCARTAAPRTIVDEGEFWAQFWDDLADELALSTDARDRLQRFDYTTVLRAHSDARDALLVARDRGLAVGVLSNFPLASIESSLRAAGLADLVDVFCCASVIGASKPAPQAYQAVLESLGMRAEECLFFDDEQDCVAGARAVGMDAYHVDRSGRPSDAPGVVAGLGSIEALIRTA